MRHTQYQIFLGIAIFYLLSSLLLRIVLWWKFSLESFLYIPLTIGVGLFNDIIQLIYLLLPLSLLLLVLPGQLLQKKWGQQLLITILCLNLYSILFLNIAEFYFFEEFNARFNLVAVDYLIYPHEVLINIWESYPVAFWLAFNLLIVLILYYPLLLIIKLNQILLFRRRIVLFIGHILLAMLANLLVTTNSFTITRDRVINEISSNGMSSFFKALRTNQLGSRALGSV